MKNFRIVAICLALVLGLAASIFAVSHFATRNVTAKTAASCCSDASCCSGGACKMNGACCANHGASQNHQVHQAGKTAGVAVETAGAVSCHENKSQTAAATDKNDCCAGGGSACCKTGASCCQSKTQTATARL